ncbi:MAG: metallopeptidase TldD-related protein [Candidatus Faecousia sp.]|nr:metallopeptidase TldD-related protein [Candidatus Faecousia sp.]
MNTVTELLRADSRVSGYKFNIHKKESFELFFVKGRLETVRSTDTCDREVTVYVDHDGFRGDAQFFIYPSTTAEQLRALIDEAVGKALLIDNQAYELPEKQTGSYTVESNFADYAPGELAGLIAEAVFSANDIPNASLNSVEIFLNRHTETVVNSRGLDKIQVRYDAMVEAIPTYNGEKQSVELYQQYNFSTMDPEAIRAEIADKLAAVKARYEAVTPEQPLDCPVVLNRQELAELFGSIAQDLNYATVYAHANLFRKGQPIQKDPTGDPIGITMKGQISGSVRSARFDSDGLSLGSIRLVEDGQAVNYYGSNRYGQYLGETPTGSLPCLAADPGTAGTPQGAYLEVISMSGLQVDLYNDYIGGEIRLAYYHQGRQVLPVTGISISGCLSQVLNTIRLSSDTAVYRGYQGPAQAILSQMKIF